MSLTAWAYGAIIAGVEARRVFYSRTNRRYSDKLYGLDNREQNGGGLCLGGLDG